MTLLILLLIIIGVAATTWFLAKRKSHPVIRPGAPSHDGAKESVLPMVMPSAPPAFKPPVPPPPVPPLPPQQPSSPRPPFTTPL